MNIELGTINLVEIIAFISFIISFLTVNARIDATNQRMDAHISQHNNEWKELRERDHKLELEIKNIKIGVQRLEDKYYSVDE